MKRAKRIPGIISAWSFLATQCWVYWSAEGCWSDSRQRVKETCPASERLVAGLFGPLLEATGIDAIGRDYKTRFQELCHTLQGKGPRYVLEEVSGPDHERLFVVTARLGEMLLGKGVGKSKKIAEQAAAREALGRLEEKEKSETL
jgi:dsRNA-specific ribonuclease